MFNQLIKVSKGFKLVYIGTLIVVLAVIGGILGSCIGLGVLGGGGAKGGLGIMMLVTIMMGLCLLAGGITSLVGECFCLAAPERAGAAKALIIIAVVLELLGMGLGLVPNLGGLAGNRFAMNAGIGMQGASWLCALAAKVLFLLFTRSMALFVKRQDLADTAILVLWMGIAIAILEVGAIVAMMTLGVPLGGGMGGGMCVAGIIGLVILVIGVMALIKFIGLMREMSDATADSAHSGDHGSSRSGRLKKRPKRRSRSYDDDDDNDDDDDYERPRRKKRREVDEDDDDDDDDDDRPRKGRRPYDW